jgi:hypothetical protein
LNFEQLVEPMNYDNLHTTAQILEAFQECRDAGEKIDLFEALAWRDEPPVEAFIEIVRKIKLEPLLALAIQALGWVKNEEIKERLKKSDDLLSLLSTLTKSGETDLICWAAAWTIKLIGFDFVSTSQYLTEMPKDIAMSIVNRREQKESIKKDAVNFWVYGRTDFFWTSDFCTDDNIDSVEKVKKIYEPKGVRGINEVNLLLIEFFKDNTPDVFNLTFGCQRVSERRILSAATSTISPRELKVLMFNQILCVSSHHAMVRRFAIKFLCSNSCPSMSMAAPDIGQAINRVNDITNEINNIVVKEVRLDENYIDNYDMEAITKIVAEDFELTTKALETEQSNELKKKNNSISCKQQEKNIVIEKIKKTSEKVTESKKYLTLLFLCSPLILPLLFCFLWLPCGFVGGLICAVLLVKGSYIPFINACSILASIALFAYWVGLGFIEYSSAVEKKTEEEKIRNNIEYEESKIKEQIRQLKDESSIEMKKAISLKNMRISGIARVKKLLDERNMIYQTVVKSAN